MIKKYISNLQEKSHAEKSNFAFLASVALTGIVASLWLLTILMNPTEYFAPETSEVQNLANSGSLFDVVKAGFE